MGRGGDGRRAAPDDRDETNPFASAKRTAVPEHVKVSVWRTAFGQMAT
jgi:hypothetical protein